MRQVSFEIESINSTENTRREGKKTFEINEK